MSDSVRLALFDLLTSDPALSALVGNKVFFQVAPSGTAYPMVVFHKQSGTTDRFTSLAVAGNELWTVKGIATSAAKAEEIAEAIDAALDTTTLTVDGKQTAPVLRTSDVSYAEVDGDNLYRHQGATYRIRIPQ